MNQETGGLSPYERARIEDAARTVVELVEGRLERPLELDQLAETFAVLVRGLADEDVAEALDSRIEELATLDVPSVHKRVGYSAVGAYALLAEALKRWNTAAVFTKFEEACIRTGIFGSTRRFFTLMNNAMGAMWLAELPEGLLSELNKERVDVVVGWGLGVDLSLFELALAHVKAVMDEPEEIAASMFLACTIVAAVRVLEGATGRCYLKVLAKAERAVQSCMGEALKWYPGRRGEECPEELWIGLNFYWELMNACMTQIAMYICPDAKDFDELFREMARSATVLLAMNVSGYSGRGTRWFKRCYELALYLWKEDAYSELRWVKEYLPRIDFDEMLLFDNVYELEIFLSLAQLRGRDLDELAVTLVRKNASVAASLGVYTARRFARRIRVAARRELFKRLAKGLQGGHPLSGDGEYLLRAAYPFVPCASVLTQTHIAARIFRGILPSCMSYALVPSSFTSAEASSALLATLSLEVREFVHPRLYEYLRERCGGDMAVEATGTACKDLNNMVESLARVVVRTDRRVAFSIMDLAIGGLNNILRNIDSWQVPPWARSTFRDFVEDNLAHLSSVIKLMYHDMEGLVKSLFESIEKGMLSHVGAASEVERILRLHDRELSRELLVALFDGIAQKVREGKSKWLWVYTDLGKEMVGSTLIPDDKEVMDSIVRLMSVLSPLQVMHYTIAVLDNESLRDKMCSRAVELVIQKAEPGEPRPELPGTALMVFQRASEICPKAAYSDEAIEYLSKLLREYGTSAFLSAPDAVRLGEYLAGNPTHEGVRRLARLAAPLLVDNIERMPAEVLRALQDILPQEMRGEIVRGCERGKMGKCVFALRMLGQSSPDGRKIMKMLAEKSIRAGNLGSARNWIKGLAIERLGEERVEKIRKETVEDFTSREWHSIDCAEVSRSRILLESLPGLLYLRRLYREMDPRAAALDRAVVEKPITVKPEKARAATLPREIVDYIRQLGEEKGEEYVIKPGDVRYVYRKKDGREEKIRIGKLLKRRPDLTKEYIKLMQSMEKERRRWFYLSTNPDDLVRKSTCQFWTSCERVGESYGKPDDDCGWCDDIVYGNAVAYLTKERGRKRWDIRTSVKWCVLPDGTVRAFPMTKFYGNQSYRGSLYQRTLDRLEEVGLWSERDAGKYCLLPYPYTGYLDSPLEDRKSVVSLEDEWADTIVDPEMGHCVLAIIPGRDEFLEEGDETGG